MSRVLVTGGAGFIGHNLVPRLLARGDEVVVLDNRTSASPMPDHGGAEYIDGDVIDAPDLGAAFDRIFHLASPASPPRYLEDPVQTLRTGSEGTRAMLDRASVDGARFLLASTSEIYGDPLIHPQTEDYFGNVDTSSPRACYDEGKRVAEAFVHAYVRAGMVEETRIARIFNTYGPAMAPDDGRIITNFVSQALSGEPLTIYGDGSQTRSFCFVDDLVEALILLMDGNHPGPMNLGNPEELTIAEVADLVEERLGNHGRSNHPLPESDPTRRRPDITLARAEIGWDPITPFRVGLDRTIDYLRSLPSSR